MIGWIKLHRQIWNNPVVTKDAEYFFLWSWLITNATHQEYDTIWKGERITLKPGQLITGRKKLSTILKIEESKVVRILNHFKNEHQIEQQTSNQGSLITILQWNKYQINEQPIEQRVNNERTTDEQRMNTIQEYKEIKKNHQESIYGNDDVDNFHFETNADRAGMTLKDFIKAKAKGEI